MRSKPIDRKNSAFSKKATKRIKDSKVKYYKFTERNSWERETWCIFVPLTKEQVKDLRKVIKESYNYSLSTETFTREQVERKYLVISSGSYMRTYNIGCLNLRNLKKINLAKNDPFYKLQAFNKEDF